jgi:hypothetical protein
MKWILALLAITGIALVGCHGLNHPSDDIENWKVAENDPVLTVGHGAMFDASGKQFEPTADFALEAQRYYLKKLYERAGKEQRAQFKERQRRLLDLTAQSRAEQMLVNATLIARLIESVKPQDAPYVMSKSMALLIRFVHLKEGEAPKDSGAGPVGKEFLDRFNREGGLKFLSATLAGGPAYIEECARAGVPIPPDWGSPNWMRRGELTTKFISTGIGAELFSFESNSPRGVCFALPRWSGNSTNLLGVICLGTDSSKSCFWDNDHRGGKPIKKGENVPLGDFLGGADLNIANQVGVGGMCTDCHAGENPFVVHPGQPMDLGAQLVPKAWSAPLVHPSWPQNPGPTNALTGLVLTPPNELPCTSCHGSDRRFPEVSTQTPGYCDIILTKAFAQTMPPTGVGDAKFKKQFDALKASCKQPPAGGVVVNGATQSAPTSDRSDTTVTLSSCTGGPDCPIGFCYWRSVHGPFWQTTPSSIPIGDPAYRGSFARIFVDGNQWKARVLVDPTGGAPQAPPGGTLECTNYQDIVTVPDPKNCFASQFTVFDKDGSNPSQSVDATVTGTASANVLSGLIGNIAQSNLERRPDTLQVTESGGKIVLTQSHNITPQSPLARGPLTGESWTNGCTSWTPTYDARELSSTSDVQLVPAAQAKNVRCYITGVTGGWSSTRNNGTAQPFAEIYQGSGGDIRLRVSPPGENDRVSALASCIRVK